jgi:hypothetical protein
MHIYNASQQYVLLQTLYLQRLRPLDCFRDAGRVLQGCEDEDIIKPEQYCFFRECGKIWQQLALALIIQGSAQHNHQTKRLSLDTTTSGLHYANNEISNCCGIGRTRALRRRPRAPFSLYQVGLRMPCLRGRKRREAEEFGEGDQRDQV